jgi:ABC-type multidrug transport system fused ATPase/permease subunit
VSNWHNIGAARRIRIRQEIVGEVRAELKAELEPVLRDQLEGELWERARETVAREQKEAAQERVKLRVAARAEAREELEREAREGAPSPRLRQGFVEFVKETEVDAHAQAVVASGSAEQLRARRRWSGRLLGPVPWLLFAGAVPALYAVFIWAGSLGAPAFIAAAAGLLVAFLTLLVSNGVRHGRLEREAKKLEKISSDYLVMAERAKSYRMVHAERLETKGRLDDLMSGLRKAKVQLDDKFHPPVDELDRARDSVRHRISVEAVDLDADFEDRLAEAEAEAVEQQEARA